MLYLGIKALHVIAVISWMAGLFYLPRLFVYHAEAEPGSQASETFKVMERRLLKAIATPALGASWLLGLVLRFGFDGVDWRTDQGFQVKFVALIALSGFHGLLARWCKEFAADKNQRSARFYRVANEVPTLLMIIIVIMVIVRPF